MVPEACFSTYSLYGISDAYFGCGGPCFSDSYFLTIEDCFETSDVAPDLVSVLANGAGSFILWAILIVPYFFSFA